jgi:hypothetical protein
MYDAAFAANIPSGATLVAGYISTVNTYHTWSPTDWDRFYPARKLPIWIAPNGAKSGVRDGWACLEALEQHGVPANKGIFVALDMETQVDGSYCNWFYHVLRWAGFKVWVYGSASTVFGNPQLNGYWVADYTGTPFMYRHAGVRATQYASNNDFDSSLVKNWTVSTGNWWK